MRPMARSHLTAVSASPGAARPRTLTVAEPGPPVGGAALGRQRGGGAGQAPAGSLGWRITGSALGLLGVLLLGFVADVAVLGPLRHARDQQVEYANFRLALANATAPVGQAGPDGKPLAPGTPVALLTIPEIGLREVVGEGTTSSVLMSGPGHRRDTVLPGQPGISVIMGRQAGWGGPFRLLNLLQPGQTFTVVTGQGRSLFRVIDLRRAGDPMPRPLVPGHSRLMLVTGSGPAFQPTGILVVDADLLHAAQPAPAALIPLGSVPPAELPNAGDPAAWYQIVLWGQALAIAVLALAWARARWGRWQTWVVGVAVIAAIGLALADQVARLLPNLL